MGETDAGNTKGPVSWSQLMPSVMEGPENAKAEIKWERLCHTHCTIT